MIKLPGRSAYTEAMLAPWLAVVQKMQLAKSLLRRIGVVCSANRIDSEAAGFLCSMLTTTPGVSPSRSSSLSAAASRSETQLIRALVWIGHSVSGTAS